MTHPLFHLAKILSDRNARRRSLRRLKDVERDPHLARDVGLPYRPRPMVRVDKW